MRYKEEASFPVLSRIIGKGGEKSLYDYIEMDMVVFYFAVLPGHWV